MKNKLVYVFLGLLLIGCSAEETLKNINEKKDANTANKPLKRGGKRALVIKHGWDVSPLWWPFDKSKGDPQAYIDEVNNSPYDGIVLSASGNVKVSENAFSSKKIDPSAFTKEFGHIDESTFPEKHNFVRMSVSNNYKINKNESPYEGDNLKNLLENTKYFAIAAQNAGIKGIMFDNENNNKIDGPNGDRISDPNKYIWRWDENDSYSICPGKSITECEEVLFQAGRKFMGTLLTHWDDIKIMPLFGIWTGSEEYWEYAIANTPHKYTWYNRNTLGHKFLLGMFSELTMRKKYWDENHLAEYIDGGEIYGMKDPNTYRAMANYIRYGITADNNPLFPHYLKEPYQEDMKTGFGVYDFRDGLFGVPPYKPNDFKQAISGALYECDYLWIYPEQHDWWSKDNYYHPKKPVTKEWLDILEILE